jgi:predicted nucleic acid-binding protein
VGRALLSAALYLDSSAVLAWLLEQPEGERMAAQIEAAGEVVASVLTVLEVERAIVRQVAAGKRSEAEAAVLRGTLARERARWTVVGLMDEVLERAGRPFPVEPIRTLDALHLSTALELLTAFPGLQVLTLDARVAGNARALGLLLAA